MRRRQPHAHLMLVSADRPFIGLGVDPVAAIGEPLECADVLNDAVFLVIGFFDQEAVVLNGSRGC